MERQAMWKKIEKLLPVVLSVLFLGLLLTFLNDTWFESDELDIIVNGQAMANGKLLYRDVTSQHMPFTYYFSALFWLLGATTVTSQRIAFYVMIVTLWMALYFRHSDIQGKLTMALYPVVFCCMIQTYDFGTAILSEHLAAVGSVMLFLEYLRYEKTKEVDWKTGVFVSVSIVLTFGTIFIAAFSVFVIAVGVLIKEIQFAKSIQAFFKRIYRKYLLLFAIVMIPWIVLIVNYLIRGTLKDFIFGAYTLNREIYPNYIGLGGDIVLTVLTSITNAISQIETIYTGWITDFSNDKLLQTIAIVCILVFIVKMANQFGKLSGCIMGLFVIYTGVRGYFNFHGTQFVGVASFITAWVLVDFVKDKRLQDKSIIEQLIVLLVSFCMLGAFLKNESRIADFHFYEDRDYDTKVVEILTEEDEEVWLTVLNNHIPIQAKRVAMARSITTPWTWEGFGEREFERVKSICPRVVIYNPEHSVWGYDQRSYASDAVYYIEENYTKVDGTGLIYVRNDYYEEACEKIKDIE